MPRTMPGQLKNHDPDSKNNEEDFFLFFFLQPDVDTVHVLLFCSEET